MRIFGITLFEESEELKQYKADLSERRRKNIAEACKKGYAPDLDLSAYVMFSGHVDDAKERLNDHNEMATIGECHDFNGKKYCYHTGKEIIK